MTKFEEEVKRPDNGPITELNNSMQSVLSQYRKMREYADFLEYELKQKDEHILKIENENSFMRDDRTTFDSNGMAIEFKLQQQALPVVPECVAKWYEEHKDDLDSSIYRLCIEFNQKVVNTLKTMTKLENWFDYTENKPIETLIRMQEGYEVEKTQLFYLKAKELLVFGDYDHVEDLWLDWNKNFTAKKQNAHKFTQQEIDSMETGSYELVPVEDGE